MLGSEILSALQFSGSILPSACDSSGTNVETFVAQGESCFEDLLFIRRKNAENSPTTPVLEVVQQMMYSVPPAGPISVARILLYPTDEASAYRYETQVLFTAFRSGTVYTVEEFLSVCKVISKKAEFKFCPGIDVDHYYNHYHAIIRYHTESCRVWDHPFKRIDSKNCFLWHELGKNAPYEDRNKSLVLCKGCKRLRSDLDHQRRRSDVSPSKRSSRQLPSSSFKLKYMSPNSVTKRKQAAQKERTRDKAHIARLNHDITLEDEQSDEVSQVMQTIESQVSKELDEVLQEGSLGPAARSIWNEDKKNSKAQFFKDQQRNCKAKHI